MRFQNENALANELSLLLDELNKKGEFNIFLHQINEGGYRSLGILNGIPQKIESILKNGFSISKYSTICGTARLIGSSKDVQIDEILDYNYYNTDANKSISVIAIPRFIEVDGQQVEFSSFNEKSNHDIDKTLKDIYFQETRYLPDAHHRKCSLFDAVKRYNELPKCYMLSVVNFNYITDCFEIINPLTHLIFKNEDEINNHKNGMSVCVKNLLEKHNVKANESGLTQREIAKAIVKSYQEEDELRFAESMFDL